MTDSASLLERISVFVNGTDSSLAGFEYGLHLAAAAGGRLTAVLVEDSGVPAIMSYADAETLARFVSEAQAIMRGAADELQRRIGGLARRAGVVATISRIDGPLLERVVELAGPASMLVIGRSPRWSEGGPLGSDSEYIVRRVRKAILVAPDRFEPPSRILAAFAGKALGGLVLSTAAGLAETLGVPLRVVTVDDDPGRRARARELAEGALETAVCPVELVQAAGAPVEQLVQRSAPDALLVMGAYGHARVHRLILGSVTSRIMREARGPIVLTAKG